MSFTVCYANYANYDQLAWLHLLKGKRVDLYLIAGESPLHMAVVNEDVSLVSYLLDYGANVSERCVGRFFCPDDQKDQRLDSVYFEHFILPKKTNYAG